MVDEQGKPKRRPAQKGVKGNVGSKRNVERAVPEKVETQVPVTSGQGITVDCFNSLLSNFTKALTVPNIQSPTPGSSQEQMLCEMGKLFLSSMMTFNQILQTHAGQAVQSNVGGSTVVPQAVAESPKHDGNKEVRGGGGGKGAGRKTGGNATGRDASAPVNSRNLKDKAAKDASTALVDVETSSPKKNPRKQERGERQSRGSEKVSSTAQARTAPKASSGSHNKVTSDVDKQVGSNASRQSTRNNAIVSRSIGSKAIRKTATVEVTAGVVANISQGSSKDDFNNAPTPNNIMESDGLVYLDNLVSPEEQLNFNIYRFVDSCTNGNLTVTEKKESIVDARVAAAGGGCCEDKLGEWLNTQSDMTKVTTTPDCLDATCRTSVVIQSPAELLRAAFLGDVELLKLQNTIDVSYVDDVGRSALHYASAAGSAACVEYLLSCNIDVNLADRKGWTAIHIAVSKNFTDVARLLVKGGADIFALLKHKCAPARLIDVYSPVVHFAAIKGNVEITQLLMEHGASVNDLDSANMTPLYYAAFRPNTEYMKFLLENGANIDLKDVNGRTPFHCAALSGMVDNAKLMVEKHEFINEEDVWSLTPYKLAELRNHSEFLVYLKESLNIVDEEENDINRVISSTIAVALQEPNADQIYRCVTRIGADLCKTVFDLTMQIERNGGVLTADGTRRRTSGGIFFTCLRELYVNNIITKEDYNYIRAAENEKRIAKANERRNKLRARC